MMSTHLVIDTAAFHLVRTLLFLAGTLLLALALLMNELFLSVFTLYPDRVASIRLGQVFLGGAGLMMLLASELVRRVGWINRFTGKRFVGRLTLALMSIAVPIYIGEVICRPWVTLYDGTSVFVRDPDLGWKHRPGWADLWGGVTVRINGKGLRGPELAYEKPVGVMRILYLGDSVTFGDGLPDHSQTFPYRVQERLGAGVQTINAGVSGYSPWQEHIYLQNEGLKYGPDLVVVNFVLNDVTEKFGLRRFGGDREGWQLAHAVSSRFEAVLSKSSIIAFAKKVIAKVRFGEDIRRGARQRERLNVEILVREPEREDVRMAWKVTRKNLGKIFDLCEQKGIRAVLVVFPFAFQLEPGAARPTPQEILKEFASQRDIPFLDLQPLLTAKGLPVEDLFLDPSHLTERGNRIVAELLLDWLPLK